MRFPTNGFIVAGLIVFIAAVREACPFPWASMFPLCGGGPPDVFDLASFAVLVITARAYCLICAGDR